VKTKAAAVPKAHKVRCEHPTPTEQRNVQRSARNLIETAQVSKVQVRKGGLPPLNVLHSQR